MNTPTTWTPPTPERDRQINIALVRAIQRFQERRAAAARISPTSSEAKRGESEGGSAATNEQHLLARTQLRDRMGQIITIDRAGTARSISHSRTL